MLQYTRSFSWQYAVKPLKSRRALAVKRRATTLVRIGREKILTDLLSEHGSLTTSELFSLAREARKDIFDISQTALSLFVTRRTSLFSIKYIRGRGGRGGQIFEVSLAKKAEAQPTVRPEATRVDAMPSIYNAVQALIAKISGEFTGSLSLEDVGLPPARTGSELVGAQRILKRITDRLERILSARLPELVRGVDSTDELGELHEQIYDLRAKNVRLEAELLEEKNRRVLAESDLEESERKFAEAKKLLMSTVPDSSLEERKRAIAGSSLQLRTPSLAART